MERRIEERWQPRADRVRSIGKVRGQGKRIKNGQAQAVVMTSLSRHPGGAQEPMGEGGCDKNAGLATPRKWVPQATDLIIANEKQTPRFC